VQVRRYNFCRLGVEYYTFHDRDISPEGQDLEESAANFDEIAELAKQLQEETGVKLLWGTANLFSHPVRDFQKSKSHQFIEIHERSRN
jgi:xylose isomerase